MWVIKDLATDKYYQNAQSSRYAQGSFGARTLDQAMFIKQPTYVNQTLRGLWRQSLAREVREKLHITSGDYWKQRAQVDEGVEKLMSERDYAAWWPQHYGVYEVHPVLVEPKIDDRGILVGKRLKERATL